MACQTLNEIRKQIDQYVSLESRYQPCTTTSPRGLMTINREVEMCAQGDGKASPVLRSLSQVLKLCMEEGRTKRTSTGELLSLAVDYHLGALDPAKAMKRARHQLQQRHNA